MGSCNVRSRTAVLGRSAFQGAHATRWCAVGEGAGSCCSHAVLAEGLVAPHRPGSCTALMQLLVKAWEHSSCPSPLPLPLSPLTGERIQKEFGLPNLVRFPIVPELSAAGDTGKPVVVEVRRHCAGSCQTLARLLGAHARVSAVPAMHIMVCPLSNDCLLQLQDPAGPTAQAFLDLGAAVVREVSLGGSSSRRGCLHTASGRAACLRHQDARLWDGDALVAAAWAGASEAVGTILLATLKLPAQSCLRLIAQIRAPLTCFAQVAKLRMTPKNSVR